MKQTDYIQGVVRTRIFEKELLTKEKFTQLIEAPTMTDLWRVLHTTSYSPYIRENMNDEQYETMLTNVFIDESKKIADIAIDPDVLHVVTLKYDYHNVKVLVKEAILPIDLSHLYSPLGTWPVEAMKEVIEGTASENVPPTVKEIINEAQAIYEETKDPQQIDIVLDYLYINDLYERIQGLHSPLLMKYVQTMIDYINVRMLLRLQKQRHDVQFLQNTLLPNGTIERERLIDSLHAPIRTIMQNLQHETIHKGVLKGLEAYEQTERLTTFEKEMDHHLMQIINDAKYIHFGPEPLIAYLMKKEAEIKNVRIIFISKQNDISVSEIKKRVRDIYV